MLWCRLPLIAALTLPTLAEAATVPLKGVYGTREVCESIAATGNQDKAMENETTDPLFLSAEGFEDRDNLCRFEAVKSAPPAGGERWIVEATCQQRVGSYATTFRLTERANGSLTVIEGDRLPFTLRLCPGKTP